MDANLAELVKLKLLLGTTLGQISVLENNEALYRKKLKTKTLQCSEEYERIIEEVYEIYKDDPEARKAYDKMQLKFSKIIEDIDIDQLLEK